MTFIAAKRFNERIIMLADTKISDGEGVLRAGSNEQRSSNVIPGMLKTWVLSLKLSVGFAGRAIRACNLLRAIIRDYDCLSDLDDILECLRQASKDGEVDFLIASHINGPQIFKIWDGFVSDDVSAAWIGDASVAEALTASIDKQAAIRKRSIEMGWTGPDVIEHMKEFGEEPLFRSGWDTLLLTDPSHSDTVGGIPIDLLASPFGHCFNGSGGAYNPDPITITPSGEILGPDGPVPPLYGQYSYSLVSSKYRGVPLLGLWLQEAATGYVYDPLRSDTPIRLANATIDDVSKLVDQRAMELGGVDIDA